MPTDRIFCKLVQYEDGLYANEIRSDELFYFLSVSLVFPLFSFLFYSISFIFFLIFGNNKYIVLNRTHHFFPPLVSFSLKRKFFLKRILHSFRNVKRIFVSFVSLFDSSSKEYLFYSFFFFQVSSKSIYLLDQLAIIITRPSSEYLYKFQRNWNLNKHSQRDK